MNTVFMDIRRYFKLCFFFIGVSFTALSYSQSFSYTIEQIPFKNPVNNFDTTYAWYCNLILPDTAHVDSIHLKMGSTPGGTELIDYSFAFDRDAFLPAGLAYKRDSTNIKLGLGNYKLRNYNIELRLEDDSSHISNPVSWSNY